MALALVTVNHLLTAQVSRQSFEGREHAVSPVVAVIEGVLNNELVTAEEISRFVDAWNDIPLPVPHPMNGETPISARSTKVIEGQSIGRFHNAVFANNQLSGELWIDVAKAHALGGDALLALQKVERGEPLEVSTAYFRDIEERPGEWKGKKYNTIARNIRPDHLALLPNAVGACSWHDGCGAPRVNQQDCACRKEPQAMNTEPESKGWGGLFDAFQALQADVRALLGQRKDQPAINHGTPTAEDGQMEKKQLIDALIANTATAWAEEDRKTLEAMDEAMLKKLEPVKANEHPAPDPKPEPKPDPKPDPAPAANIVYPPAVQRLIDEDEAARKALVAKLSANQACRLTAEELQKQDRDFLERLDQTLTPADYSGRGLPRPQTNTQNFDFDPAPGDANFKFEQAH